MPHGTPVASHVTHENFIHRLHHTRDPRSPIRVLTDRRTLRACDHESESQEVVAYRDSRAWFGIAVAVRQPDSDVGEQRLTGQFACRHRDRISGGNRSE